MILTTIISLEIICNITIDYQGNNSKLIQIFIDIPFLIPFR